MSARTRRSIALGSLLIAAVFIAYLPQIYLGEDGDWEDFLLVMSYQRLGMLLAIPDLLEFGGARLLIGGLPTNLNDLVEGLYAAGLLPEVFADGGAIAVFDVMWFGFLIVGGMPFLLGAALLLRLGLRRHAALQTTEAGQALRLYALAALVLSFSSQILLSRYGLYLLCFFIAAAAVAQPAAARPGAANANA